MESTVTYALIAIVGVIALVVFLFIAKRVVGMAVRLALVAVFILLLVAGGAWLWWNGWLGSPNASPPPRPMATPRRSPR